MVRSKLLPTTTGWARRLATTSLGVAAAFGVAAGARAAQPHPWQLGFQPAATPVQQRIDAFNIELTVIIGLITVFVLGLLVYVIVRFDRRRHPVPSRRTHNTVIELLWTAIPALILVIIAVPSFKLMFYMARVPKDAAMTIEVTGHQWYWSYKYSQAGGLAFDSTLVQEANLESGQPRLLTVNNPLVVPVDTDIRVLVTSTDVIHSWFMPSFGVQEYAMPGQQNESWFRVLAVGIYRGQCNQICGLNHAFMPIEVEAVSKDAFQRWLVAAKKRFAEAGAPVQVAAVPRASRPAAAGN